MTIVLGVDGGGSKTHAVIVDEQGQLLGFATNGPSNWETVGLRGARTRSARRPSGRSRSAAGASTSCGRRPSGWPASTGTRTYRG